MMLKNMMSRTFLICCLWGIAATASAAPKQIKLVYEATRNGQPFATVTETFKQENGRYRIESVTQGQGVYALFGKRTLTSEGEVTPEGLKPSKFVLDRGDNPKKSLSANFDWAANKLTMLVKGKPVTAPLEKGTQDLTSFVYQFMFKQPAADVLKLPVTTGKKLKTYHYKATGRDVAVQVPAGNFKTIHLVNADVEEPDDEKELWLGAESYYLPVRIIAHDDGNKLEQHLTSLQVE
ncbi:MAG TPA: DUF3108 domain-containing protein [Methylophilaceae bacterium]|nr:DUF3108 domain-containing protein [Methylophilaceae bacterium]